MPKLEPINPNQPTNQSANQNNTSTKKEESGIIKTIGQLLPLAPFVYEQFTGQKVPQMSGTMAEIQMALQQILTNQQALNQRLVNLENNATQQFTGLIQQVQSIKSVRLSHERKQIDYNLENQQ